VCCVDRGDENNSKIAPLLPAAVPRSVAGCRGLIPASLPTVYWDWDSWGAIPPPDSDFLSPRVESFFRQLDGSPTLARLSLEHITLQPTTTQHSSP